MTSLMAINLTGRPVAALVLLKLIVWGIRFWCGRDELDRQVLARRRGDVPQYLDGDVHGAGFNPNNR